MNLLWKQRKISLRKTKKLLSSLKKQKKHNTALGQIGKFFLVVSSSVFFQNSVAFFFCNIFDLATATSAQT
jgi:hypothetical protein